jgi:hypothetical protein
LFLVCLSCFERRVFFIIGSMLVVTNECICLCWLRFYVSNNCIVCCWVCNDIWFFLFSVYAYIEFEISEMEHDRMWQLYEKLLDCQNTWKCGWTLPSLRQQCHWRKNVKYNKKARTLILIGC